MAIVVKDAESMENKARQIMAKLRVGGDNA